MEYIDVLDEKGNKTDKSKPRSEIHRDGDWHRVVHVWLLNSKGELLIQLRSKTKDSYANKWDFSGGGHIEAGNNSLSAAVREIQEELGLNLNPEQFLLIGEIAKQAVLNNNTYFNNEFVDVYIVKEDVDISTVKIQESEVAEVKWMPWKELEKWVKEGGVGLVPHPDEYKLLFNYLKTLPN